MHQTALQALSLPLRKPSRRPQSRGKKQKMVLQGRVQGTGKRGGLTETEGRSTGEITPDV